MSAILLSINGGKGMGWGAVTARQWAPIVDAEVGGLETMYECADYDGVLTVEFATEVAAEVGDWGAIASAELTGYDGGAYRWDWPGK